MAEAQITVTLTPLEMKLLRHAIAKATDNGEVSWKDGLQRILELERLRREAEEREDRDQGSGASGQKKRGAVR